MLKSGKRKNVEVVAEDDLAPSHQSRCSGAIGVSECRRQPAVLAMDRRGDAAIRELGRRSETHLRRVESWGNSDADIPCHKRRDQRGGGEEADETRVLRSGGVYFAHDNLLLVDCTPDRGAESEVIAGIYLAILHK
jgi:hypothetical protein